MLRIALPNKGSLSEGAVSIVFETNGRCEPHRILVWKDGKDEDSATVLTVDRFGTIKNPESEDDDR